MMLKNSSNILGFIPSQFQNISLLENFVVN